MKKILIFILVIIMAASFGCAANDKGEAQKPETTKVPLDKLDFTPHAILPGGDVEILRPTEGVDSIYLADFVEVVSPAVHSGEPGAYYTVVTDYDELIRLTGDLSGRTEKSVTAETLSSDFVVAVFVTVRSGGFTFETERASNDGHTVTVNVTVTPPAPGSFVTQALETRCILAGFSRADFYDDLVYEITVNGEAVSSGAAAE